MKQYNLDNDITVLCITAKSFPAGIGDAFQNLEKIIGTRDGRVFYGISRPEGKGSIVYKAAVEQLKDDEAEQYECETFVIKNGQYLGETINDWRKDETVIGRTFQTILQEHSRLDPNGACIEKYINDTDVICMVRLNINA